MRPHFRISLAGLAGAAMVLLGFPASGFAQATVFYVAPGGSSSNADTSCATAAYSSINAAIGAAPAGATIIVCAGTYTEDVAVTKALQLIGQNAVIDATGLNNGITITASNVTVSGITVENAVGEGILAQATPIPGPVVNGHPFFTGHPLVHVVIKHNVVRNNDRGGPQSSYQECRPQGEVPGDCGEGIHLMGVAHSAVLVNIVENNLGGILLSDEFGPTHDNLIAGNIVRDNAPDCGITLASHNLGFNLQTQRPQPSFAGVYHNTIRDNISIGNGTNGEGAGVGIFAPFPGTASYGNLIQHNTIAENTIAGVSLHSHAPGAWLGDNRIVDNLVGPNNLVGDPDAGDSATTGILVWSAATPIRVTIAGNTIFDDWYGIWLSKTVTAPGAYAANHFLRVSTLVHRAS